MPTIKVVNMSGAEVGTMELSDVLFGAEVNGTVLHAVLQDIFQEITAGPSDTKSWSAEVHPGDLLQIVGNREGLLERIPAILVDDGTEKASHYIPDSDYASSVAELKKFGYTGLYLNKRRLVWKGRPQGEDDRWMLDFRSYVAETIDTIFDPSIPFNQCQDPANCEHCGYLNLCRRQPPKRSY